MNHQPTNKHFNVNQNVSNEMDGSICWRRQSIFDFINKKQKIFSRNETPNREQQQKKHRLIDFTQIEWKIYLL